MFRNFGADWRGLPRPFQGISESSMFSVPSNRSLFLDGGGKLRQHHVVAYCGFMAHPAAMEEFENTWRTLCSLNGLLDGFHMTDAMRWSGDVWAKKRAEWGAAADGERDILLRAFATTIKNSSLRAVGSVADSAHLNEKAQGSARPDLVMFEKAIENAIGAMQPDGSLFLFCDWEDGFDALCCKLLAKLRITRPDLGQRVKMLSFADDQSYAQLQAADMFAWLACKEALRNRDDQKCQPDSLFKLLTETTVTTTTPMAEMFDAEAFRRMVDAHR